MNASMKQKQKETKITTIEHAQLEETYLRNFELFHDSGMFTLLLLD